MMDDEMRQDPPQPEAEPEPAAEAPVAETPAAPADAAAGKLAEMEDKYRRALADLANLHKRFQKERERIHSMAVAGFVAKLLPVVDNMTHSLKAAHESHDPAALIEGFALLETQLMKIFQSNGIERIESEGKPFDPEVHHAVAPDVTDQVLPGTVTEELAPGFVSDGYVIRPAQVRVATAPPAESNQ